MAFTKITASGIGSTETVTLDGLSVINDGSFGGNLSVGGTLTYEDVTNIDSVGLITARAGVVVGSGITLSKDGDIFATGITTVSGNVKVGTGITLSPDGDGFFTGVVTATTFKGDGSQLSNVTSTTINNNADNRLITGSGTANTLEGESSLTYDGTSLKIGGDSSVSGTWNLETYNSGGDGTALIAGASGAALVLQDTGSSEVFKLAANGQASLYSQKAGDNMVFYTKPSGGSDTERARITSTGIFLIGRTSQPNDINKLVVTGTSPADVFDNTLYLEGSETSGAANTGGALAFGGHDGSGAHRNWCNIYGMKENGTGGNTAAYMSFHTRAAGGSPAEKMRISSDGHVLPAANNTYDLGSTGTRWRNVYTNDLNLSNKGSTNSVDNTWGDYTIQEGENDLFLINNRSGKKYKFNLTEVS